MLTIGVFDGVHRGHQALIREAVATGRSLGLPTVLMTFDPHPAEVVRPGSHPAMLTTLRRRAELVAELGVDALPGAAVHAGRLADHRRRIRA